MSKLTGGGSGQNTVQLTYRTASQIDTDTYYYYAFKFDDNAELAPSQQPQPAISGENAGENWDAYVYFKAEDVEQRTDDQLFYQQFESGDQRCRTTGGERDCSSAWFRTKTPQAGETAPFIRSPQSLAMGNKTFSLFLRSTGLEPPDEERILSGFWVTVFTADAPIHEVGGSNGQSGEVLHSLSEAIFVENQSGFFTNDTQVGYSSLSQSPNDLGDIIPDPPEELRTAAQLDSLEARTIDNASFPDSMTLSWEVTASEFDPQNFYFTVVNFDNAPSLAEEDRPLPQVSGEDQGQNWEMFIMYTQNPELGEGFYFDKRGPDEVNEEPDRWFNNRPPSLQSSGRAGFVDSANASNGEITLELSPDEITNHEDQQQPRILVDFIVATTGIDDATNLDENGEVVDHLSQPLVLELFSELDLVNEQDSIDLTRDASAPQNSDINGYELEIREPQ